MNTLPLTLLPPLLSLATGLFLAMAAIFQAPQRMTNRLFSLVCLFWVLLAPAFLAHGLFADEAQILTVERAIHGLYVFLPVANLAFFHHVLGLRRPRLTRAAWLISAALALTVPTPWYFNGILHYPWGSIARGGPAFQLFGVYSGATAIYFIAIFLHGIRRETDPRTRRQLGTVLAAFGLMTALTLLNVPAINGIDLYPAGNFVFLPLGVLAFGLLRHRLLDFRDLAQNSTAWLLPLTLGALLNFLVFLGLRPHAARLAPLPQYLLLLLWFTLNLLLLYKTKPMVDRLFRPGRYFLNARRLRCMDQLAQLRTLDDLERAVASEIGTTLGFRRCLICFHQPDSDLFLSGDNLRLHLTAEEQGVLLGSGSVLQSPRHAHPIEKGVTYEVLEALFQQTDAEVLIPLVREDKLLALIALAEREGGSPLKPEERRYLEALAAAGGVAVSNSLLYHRVAQLNERLEFQARDLQQQIIEREEAQRALQLSERKFRLLAENTLDVIWVLDPATRRFVFISPSVQRLTGYTVDEALEMELADLLTPGSLVAVSDKLQRIPREILEDGAPTVGKSLELELRRKGGTTVWTEVTTSFLNDPELPISGMLGVTRDITERRDRQTAQQAGLAAEKASRAKSEFLANMSHELRTPLNHIIGFTELVVEQHFGPLNDPQVEYLGDVLHSSHHLLDLINDILDLSKVEAGRMELERTHFPLRPVLENSLTMVKEKSLKRGIRVALEANEAPANVMADMRKLKQILYNLLSNAIKFTPDGGHVVLAARVNGDPTWGDRHLEISVRDTGIGLRAADLERIFNTFEQVDSSASRRFEGTGLGLALSRRMVELHAGRIWAESEGEGHGSRFVFTLPF